MMDAGLSMKLMLNWWTETIWKWTRGSLRQPRSTRLAEGLPMFRSSTAPAPFLTEADVPCTTSSRLNVGNTCTTPAIRRWSRPAKGLLAFGALPVPRS